MGAVKEHECRDWGNRSISMLKQRTTRVDVGFVILAVYHGPFEFQRVSNAADGRATGTRERAYSPVTDRQPSSTSSGDGIRTSGSSVAMRSPASGATAT
jgi:hypothetical protein